MGSWSLSIWHFLSPDDLEEFWKAFDPSIFKVFSKRTGQDWVTSSQEPKIEGNLSFLLHRETSVVVLTNIDFSMVRYLMVEVPYLVSFELLSGGYSAFVLGKWDPDKRRELFTKDFFELLQNDKRMLQTMDESPLTISRQLEDCFLSSKTKNDFQPTEMQLELLECFLHGVYEEEPRDQNKEEDQCRSH